MKRIVYIATATFVMLSALLALSLMGSPQRTARGSGGINLVVLCTSCASGNIDNHGPVGDVVLDQNTGNVWLYTPGVFFSDQQPIMLGKMTEVGKRLEPVKQ